MLNNDSKTQKATIIGAGLCGLMIAIYLAKRGYLVEIYEKSSHLNVNLVSEKRATDLDLSSRALLALSDIGLLDQVIAKSVSTSKRVIFSGGEALTIAHGEENKDVIYNIARSHLYDILFSSVKKQANISVHFSQEVISVDAGKNLLFLKTTKDTTLIAKHYSLLLGCDGMNSVIRHILNNKNNYNKKSSYSYKSTALPLAFVKENLLTKNMYKWTSKQVALLAHPNINQNFNITLLLPTPLEDNFLTVFTKENFPHLQSVNDYLSYEFIQQRFNRVKSIKVACQYKDNILLLGDAAHGMLPFLGQGINCAFEDCRLLNSYLSQYEDNWERAVKHFAENRKMDTDAIIDMSEIEYQEFQPEYDFKKIQFIEKIQAKLSKRHPHLFKSHRYLLAFTHQSYAKIHHYHQRQKAIFSRIYHHFKAIEGVHWEKVDEWISDAFKEYAIPYCCHY